MVSENMLNQTSPSTRFSTSTAVVLTLKYVLVVVWMHWYEQSCLLLLLSYDRVVPSTTLAFKANCYLPSCNSQTLSSFSNAEETKKKQRCCRHLTTTYIQNNFKKIFFLFFYLLVNAGLGVCNAWRYWHKNTWLIVGVLLSVFVSCHRAWCHHLVSSYIYIYI